MKQCIFGNHLKFGDMFIEKTPEGVVQCLECAKIHNDENVYNSKEGDGWRVGQYGIGYYKGVADRRTGKLIISE